MATGMELLKEELAKRGFSASKIASNTELIFAVISVLSENKEEIDGAKMYYDAAKQTLEKAKKQELEARKCMTLAVRERRAVMKKASKTQSMLQELRDTQEEMERFKQLLGTAETAEARDMVRLASMFDSMTERKTCYDNTAYINWLAAILSGKENGGVKNEEDETD